MKVLVIPEDPTLDQYILKPIVERLFTDWGKSPRIQILSKPRLRGVSQALDASILADIVATYPMVDLFLVMVDRDGDLRRPERVKMLESAFPQLLSCLAIEEVEVWMLALHRETLAASWHDIRAEHHPKERFAQPFLVEHAPKLDPGQGRAWAMRELGGKWKGILAVCPELEEFSQRLGARLQTEAR
ncbi:MAG TPA: hypothetical protein VK539_28985 [Myxococcaceae bacterium]|nr:hypothetical protein [Myxococcaceae bacterium]